MLTSTPGIPDISSSDQQLNGELATVPLVGETVADIDNGNEYDTQTTKPTQKQEEPENATITATNDDQAKHQGAGNTQCNYGLGVPLQESDGDTETFRKRNLVAAHASENVSQIDNESESDNEVDGEKHGEPDVGALDLSFLQPTNHSWIQRYLPVVTFLFIAGLLSLSCAIHVVFAIGLGKNWYHLKEYTETHCTREESDSIIQYEKACLFVLYAFFSVAAVMFVLVTQPESWWGARKEKGIIPQWYASLFERKEFRPVQLWVLRSGSLLLLISGAACLAVAIWATKTDIWESFSCLQGGYLSRWAKGSLPVLYFAVVPSIGHLLYRWAMQRFYGVWCLSPLASGFQRV
ncbi:hypothetical protein Pelo_4808 [Pelomyxa schiedti]|nr:hypothetical protein Pelo_4808 [Pelomyxa schiedti]